MSKNKKSLRDATEDDGKSYAPLIFILIAVGIIGILTFLLLELSNSGPERTDNNVTAEVQEGGKQILELKAKGGYSPSTITAKADTESLLKIKTQNTYDCSNFIRIPDLNFSKTLPATGETVVAIPSQKSGSQIRGTCGMGMYSFVIKFI